MITPKEIEMKIFKKGAFGYDKDDVDQYLDAIILDYEKALTENKQLKEKVDELNESINYYRSIERSLQSTLALGEKTAEDTIRAAEEEKLRVERDARVYAEEMRIEAERKMREYKESLNSINDRFENMRSRLRSLLTSELDVLDKLEVEDCGRVLETAQPLEPTEGETVPVAESQTEVQEKEVEKSQEELPTQAPVAAATAEIKQALDN